MSENPFSPPFEYKRLAKSIADAFGIDGEEMLGRKRTREYAQARALLTSFLLDRGWSHSRIGRILGRDHTTIINARRQLPVYLGYYPEVLEVYQQHCALRHEVER